MNKKKKLALHWKILIGLVAGVVWSVVSGFAGWSEFTINWISPFGDIFLRMLKLVAVPLILFSIINGISSLSGIDKLGRIGWKTFLYYVTTTVLAVSLGLLLVNTIAPGERINPEKKSLLAENISSLEENPDPKITARKQDADKMRSASPMQFLVDIFPENIFFSLSNNMLMLQIIVFAIFFGICLMLIPPQHAQPIKSLVQGMNEVILKMVNIIMQGAPCFVFALLAGVIAKMAGNHPALLIDIFEGLGWFALTAIIGLLILLFLIYPVVVHVFIKGLTWQSFLKRITEAQLVAFSTSSSAATLPVTMKVIREKLGVSEDVTSFVLPIGATVNMDGTSLYQAVCAVFLAQFFGHDLSFSAQLTIVLTATLASIGAPAVPSAGLVMLIIVLESVGLPAWWIALIFPIDRPLDMLRTVVNVTGDATAATLIAKSENELTIPDQTA